jgi:hypothetical protein
MRSKRKGSFHSPRRTFAETAEFPQWMLVGGILLVGFLLLTGALSDASGKLSKPGLGSVLYMAALIGVGAVLLYSGRHRRSTIKTDRNSRAVPNRLPPIHLRWFLGRCLGAICGRREVKLGFFTDETAMNLLLSTIAVAFGTFAAIWPAKTARIWGSTLLDKSEAPSPSSLWLLRPWRALVFFCVSEVYFLRLRTSRLHTPDIPRFFRAPRRRGCL